MPPTAVKITLIILLLISFSLHGQVGPDDGTRVCSRFIGFSVANMPMETQTLEIAKGIFADTTSFNQNIFTTVLLKNDKTTAKVPTFGTDYTWRIKEKKNLHYFSTLPCPYADTAKSRLRIVKGSQTDQDYYVLVDKTMCLYDMKGNIAWFLPGKCLSGTAGTIRDLKLTPQHTVTFIAGNQIREVDCDGNILWKGPNDGKVSHDTTEAYHHEFTRLVNGHYMVLANELVPMTWVKSPSGDSSLIAIEEPAHQRDPKARRLTASYGTIIEYDKFGKLLWSWKSSSYYKNVAFRDCKTKKPVLDLHENAFFYDEKTSSIYISYKNLSQVIKLKYPEGEIQNILGNLYYVNAPCSDTALFWEQHACKISSDGYLMLFNNNVNNLDSSPIVELLEEPANSKYYLKKVWEYQYPINHKGMKRLPLTNGGNVIELSDKSIFVSMCTPYGNLFIVNRNKELLWDAVLEKLNAGDKKWIPVSQYRASIIEDRKSLDNLIMTARTLPNQK